MFLRFKFLRVYQAILTYIKIRKYACSDSVDCYSTYAIKPASHYVLLRACAYTFFRVRIIFFDVSADIKILILYYCDQIER